MRGNGGALGVAGSVQMCVCVLNKVMKRSPRTRLDVAAWPRLILVPSIVTVVAEMVTPPPGSSVIDWPPLVWIVMDCA